MYPEASFLRAYTDIFSDQTSYKDLPADSTTSLRSYLVLRIPQLVCSSLPTLPRAPKRAADQDLEARYLICLEEKLALYH